MNATSVEEALARAKAIAAKLAGGTTSNATTSAATTAKRSRWGVTPEDDAVPKKAKTVAEEKVSKRLWISTTEERPAAHFRAYLQRQFPAVLSQINATKDDHVCSIELQGRGSGGKPPLPGMPLEPLHILMEGTSRQLTQAEPLVENLLQDAEEAPIEEEAIREEKEAEENKKYAIVAVAPANGGTGSLSSYRPASVALLIGQANNPDAHDAHTNGRPWIETSINVPTGLVGFIIGKGGENVARIQSQTGARLQIQREADLQPGQTSREISISAPDEGAAEECKRFIENIVADKTRQMGDRGGGGGFGGPPRDKDAARVQEAVAAGHEHLVVKVPDADVGLVIGKAGATIKSLQDRSGASIQVLPNSDSDGMRTVNVTHPHPDGARQAKAMIEDILQSKVQKYQDPGQQTTLQVMIPDSDVGLCIGRQGSVIRHMQNVTNTRIQIPSQCNPGEMHRVAEIQGKEDGCKQAQQMIQRIIAEQSSAGVMSGQPPAQQQYYQQAPTEGQQGYSAEWAAYHAAQQAAAAQPQQSSYSAGGQQQQPSYASHQSHHRQGYAAHQAPAPAPASQQQTTTDTTYHEQFFRYAYYYGEEAARAYYGAWSPPVGMPNPYGTNPNGIQPAPAAAPAQAAPAPAPVAAPVYAAAPSAAPVAPVGGEARETSRRRVSNLPAWMTKK